jgi:hypothetical protein
MIGGNVARKSRSRDKDLKVPALFDEAWPPQQQEGKASKPSVVVHVNEATINREKNKVSDQVDSIIEYEEDLGDAEAPVPLPEGDYPAVIRGANKKKNKDGDKEYADVTFFIAPEQYPADFTDGNPDGWLGNYGMGRLPTAGDVSSRYRMRKFCEAIGAELGRTLDLNKWLDLPAVVTIKHETYEGETRARIAKVGAA